MGGNGKWRLDFRFRIGYFDSPYFRFNAFNGIDTYFGFLWFKFNIQIYKQYIPQELTRC